MKPARFLKAPVLKNICQQLLPEFLFRGSHGFFSVQAQTEMVEEWWSESLHCHLYFPQNNHFLNKNINLTSYFQYLFRWVKIYIPGSIGILWALFVYFATKNIAIGKAH